MENLEKTKFGKLLLNKQLLELYSSKWGELCSAILPIFEDDELDMKPSNPLLLSIDNEEKFNKSDIRVMVFGQETNGWGDPEYDADIQCVLNEYNNFYHSGNCYSYGGQFWNGVSRFQKMFAEKYPNKKIAYVWNNIVKIGKCSEKGCPPDYIYNVEKKYFSVIKDEIQILRPNVILFLTGPNYDSKIKDKLGEVASTALLPFGERELACISIPDVDFAFRTYHPNFLWRNDIESFFNAIIKEINIE